MNGKCWRVSKIKYLGDGKGYYDHEVNHSGTAVSIAVAPYDKPTTHILLITGGQLQ
jgi:hypothetical protein